MRESREVCSVSNMLVYFGPNYVLTGFFFVLSAVITVVYRCLSRRNDSVEMPHRPRRLHRSSATLHACSRLVRYVKVRVSFRDQRWC